jgi:hypothetical protein
VASQTVGSDDLHEVRYGDAVSDPTYKTEEQFWVRRIASRSARLDRLVEMEAPSIVIERERQLLHDALVGWKALGLEIASPETRDG